jgi:hypothetical protein
MLITPLREAIAKGDKQSLHQVIVGEDATSQAREYARELVGLGIVKSTPVELDCNQPMSSFMVQEAFKEAKKGVLIVDGIEHLARQETFTSLAVRAAEKNSCIVVMCGTDRSLRQLFAEEAELPKHYKSKIDMTAPAIREEMLEYERQRKDAEIRGAFTVQTPVEVMKQIKFGPKT